MTTHTANSLTNRFSVREFSDKSVAVELLKTIISEAQGAPSWENTQPWKAYVAVGDTLKQIKATHFTNVKTNVKSWTEVVPPSEWSATTQANMDKWLGDIKQFWGEQGVKNFWDVQGKLFDAPAVVYITIPKSASAFSAYDAGGFGYGVMLSAFEHGLGSVPAYEFVRFPKEIREQFEIPSDEALFMGIGLGYAKEAVLNNLRTTREPLAAVLQIKE